MAQTDFGCSDIRYRGKEGESEPEQVVESGPQVDPVLTSTNPCGHK